MFLSKIRASSGAADRAPGSDFWFDALGSRTKSGERVTPATAQMHPAVFACQRVLSESFAVMPFNLFRPKESGGRERLTKHWLWKLFNKRPNRFQSAFEWRLMLQGHLVMRGNAFCQIDANESGEITELLPLHPDRMQVELLDNGSYRYRYTDRNGRVIYYARGELWHLRGLSNDGIVGLSPIEVEREAIGEGLAMQSYSARFFANDARPSGWIEVPQKFPDKGSTKQKFREDWHSTYGGANKGKVAILEMGMKFHEMANDHADMQFMEGRGRNVTDIARIFRVPPHKIGDLSKSTNNNIEHQGIEFWTDTMLPWAELWESSIERFLLGEDSDLDPEFDMDRMMRGDSAARAAYYSSRTQWGSLTPNEVREREGDDPLPWLNHTMRPVNMARVDESGETIPNSQSGADTKTPAEEDARKANAKAAGEASGTRMMALLRSNADRMARRIAGGNAPTPEVLSEALAIEAADAAAWLQNARHDAGGPGVDAQSIAESLVSLALGNKPNPAEVGAAAMQRLAVAINAMPQPVVNVNVEPAAVSVQPADVRVNVEPAQVHVAQPQINVEAQPAPQVHVNVEQPAITVQAAQAPEVHVSVKPTPVVVDVKPTDVRIEQTSAPNGGQQPRPWPTETVITKRDKDGRADVIETRPIDD
jgi:HK97 family phage portal protein